MAGRLPAPFHRFAVHPHGRRHRVPCPLRNLLLALAITAVAGGAAAQQEGASPVLLVDRVLAAVDDDPILASDVDRAIAFGLAGDAPEGEDEESLRRRVLEGLIDQRLRFHEVDRFGFTQVPVAEIEARVEEIRSRFPDEAAYQRRLAELDIDEEGLKQLVTRQLLVLAYVDERLGARIFVSLDEIRDFYTGELVPAMEAEGTAVPAIETVREQIRGVLRERRLVDEIERWTEGLHAKADVVNHFDSRHRELPPVVETYRPR